jgi:hypothetical protein
MCVQNSLSPEPRMFFAVLSSVLLTAVPILSKPFPPLRSGNVLINDFMQLSAPLLEVFQVYPPPLSPSDLLDSTACSFTLMNHVFGNSAGNPFVGTIAYNSNILVVKSDVKVLTSLSVAMIGTLPS